MAAAELESGDKFSTLINISPTKVGINTYPSQQVLSISYGPELNIRGEKHRS
jgi:hypothetical protein